MRQYVDDGGKMKKGKERNLINALLFFTFVLGVAGVFVRYAQSKGEGAADIDRAYIHFEIEGVSRASVEALSAGDEFINESSNTVVGILADEVRVSEHTEILIDDNGGVSYRREVGKYDVQGTLICEGSFGKSGFLHEGRTHMAPNQYIDVNTKTLDTRIHILKIEKI